jgi:hypothetical protein
MAFSAAVNFPAQPQSKFVLGAVFQWYAPPGPGRFFDNLVMWDGDFSSAFQPPPPGFDFFVVDPVRVAWVLRRGKQPEADY